MGGTTEQIAAEIRQQRDALGANVRELEDKISTAVDWRHYVGEYPVATLGAAIGGGIVFGMLTGGRRSRYVEDSEQQRRPMVSSRGPSHFQEQTRETLGFIQGALLGVGIARLTEFIDSKLPGFRDHFERTQQNSSRTR